MSAELSMQVEPRRDELERIHAAVEDLAEREEWSPGLIFRVNLILEELVINIMDYGDDEGRHRIEVTVTSDPDEVVMDLVDSGKPFDPTHDAPEPDIGASLDERRVGGDEVDRQRPGAGRPSPFVPQPIGGSRDYACVVVAIGV